jgi:hypothetical protein
MKWLALVLLLAVPCFADEEEAIAALKTSGIVVGKIKTGGYLIRVDNPDISNERFKRIKELPDVREVMLFDGRNFEPQLKLISELGTVTHLFISADCHNESMKPVGAMKSLKVLSVSSDLVTDAGLKHLHSLSNLRSASFSGRLVTQAGKESLNEALPKCVVK